MPIRFDPMAPAAADVFARAAGSQVALADRRQRDELALRRQELATRAGIAQLEASTRAGLGDQQAFGRMSDREQEAFQFQEVMRFRHAAQQAETERALAVQRERAGLSVWASQQEMSFAESQRLQRLKSSLGAVEAMKDAGQLTPDEYYDAVAQLRTGISPIEQKQRATQQRALEAQAKMREEEARFQAVQYKTFEQMQAAGGPQVHYTAPEEIVDQFERQLPPVPPDVAAKGGPELERWKGLRRKKAAENAYRAGHGSAFVIGEPGKWTQVKPEAAERERKIDMKAVQDEAEMAVPPDEIDERGNPRYSSPERLQEFYDYKRRIFERERGGGQPQGGDPRQGRQDAGSRAASVPRGRPWKRGEEKAPNELVAKGSYLADLAAIKAADLDGPVRETAEAIAGQMYDILAAGGGAPDPDRADEFRMLEAGLARTLSAAKPKSGAPAAQTDRPPEQPRRRGWTPFR